MLGFDDIAMAAWTSYRLSTVRQDPPAMARAAVTLLLERIADPRAARWCRRSWCCALARRPAVR